MSGSLQKTGTHFSKFLGSMVKAASNPSAARIVGLRTGQMYFKTDTKDIYFYTSAGTWLGVHTVS